MGIEVVQSWYSYDRIEVTSGNDWFARDGNDDFLSLATPPNDDVEHMIGVLLWRDTSTSGTKQWEPGGARKAYNDTRSRVTTVWSAQSMRRQLISEHAFAEDESFWRKDMGQSSFQAGDVLALGLKGLEGRKDDTRGYFGEINSRQNAPMFQYPGAGSSRKSTAWLPGGTMQAEHFLGVVNADNTNFMGPYTGTWAAQNSPGMPVDQPGDLLICTVHAFADDAWADGLNLSSQAIADGWTKVGYHFNDWGALTGAADRRHHTAYAYLVVPEAGYYNCEWERVNPDASTADHMFMVIDRVYGQRSQHIEVPRQRFFFPDSQEDRGSWQGDSGETTNLHQKIEPQSSSEGVATATDVKAITSASVTGRPVGNGTVISQGAEWPSLASTAGSGRILRFRARRVGNPPFNLTVRLDNNAAFGSRPNSGSDTQVYEVDVPNTTMEWIEIPLEFAWEFFSGTTPTIEFGPPQGVAVRQAGHWGDASNHYEIEYATDNPDSTGSRYERTDLTDWDNFTQQSGDDLILELQEDFTGDSSNDSTYIESDLVGAAVEPEFTSIFKMGIDFSGLSTPFLTEFGAFVRFRARTTNFTPGVRGIQVALAENGTQIGGSSAWFEDSLVNNSTSFDHRQSILIPAETIAAVTNWANAELWIRGYTVSQNATESRLEISAIDIDGMGPASSFDVPPDLLELTPDSVISGGSWQDETESTPTISSIDPASDIDTTTWLESEDVTTLTAQTFGSELRLGLSNPPSTPDLKWGLYLRYWAGTRTVGGGGGSSAQMTVALYEGTTPIWGYVHLMNQFDECRDLLTIPYEAAQRISNWNNLELRFKLGVALVGTLESYWQIFGASLMYMGEAPPPGEKSHSTDAILFEVPTVEHTADALLASVVEVDHDTDAILQAELELTHTADARLVSVVEVTHTADADVRVVTFQSHTTDALLRLVTELTHSADAYLGQSAGPTSTLDDQDWDTAPTPGGQLHAVVDELEPDTSDYIEWTGA